MEFHAFISMDIVLRVESLLVSFFQGINLLCNCKRTIFFYKRSDDFLIHRLGNRRGIRKNNDQFPLIKCWYFWWAGQLSIIKAMFLFWAPTFWSISLNNSSNSSDNIQLLVLPDSDMERFSHLQDFGVFDLPITNIGSLSPFTLTAAIPVKQTLLCLPTVHFPFLKWFVLLDTHR